MKKIISGEDLQNKMKEAVNLLCDTVKCTLGPKGNNVIIDSSNFNPFITNDGVTIAESIDSEDEVISAILELAKEASIKTNQEVGDGTTSTLVMLQSLFNLSLDLINKGENPIILKKKLNKWLDKILNMLEKERLMCDDKIIYNIAKVSSNDSKIAKIVSEVYKNISYKEAINIKEVNDDAINVSYYNGYSLSIELVSPLFLKDVVFVNYQNSFILIIDDVLNDLENLGGIINEFFDSDKSLIIIANDYSFDVINNIVSYVLNGNLKCILLKILEYGLRKRMVFKDLEVLSDAIIVNNEKNISEKNLGVLKSVFITKDILRVSFKESDRISKYVLSVNEELKEIDDDYTKEFYFKRLSMFHKGTALIEIGAYTKTELREKRMRLDDALCAVYSSNLGIVIGGGVTLLKIASQINDDDNVAEIWKESLEMPFKQLMKNAGENYNKIKERLEKENFNLVYNVTSGCFENKSETNIVDPYKIVNKTIINACSIASMLITTSSLVINENVNNLNKVIDYGDI